MSQPSKIRLLLGFYLLFGVCCLFGQQPSDSLVVVSLADTLAETSTTKVLPPLKADKSLNTWLKKDYPNPKRAMLLSLVLPGAGQAYNRKYWKMPILYAGLGTAIGFEILHVKKYREYRDNYKAMVDADPLTLPIAAYATVPAPSLKVARDTRQKWMEQTGIAIGLIYLFGVADAFVDAHLASFDVSDDITMRFKPSFQNNLPAFGVSLSLK